MRLILVLLLLPSSVAALVWLVHSGKPDVSTQLHSVDLQDDGANVYASRCVACHQADGRGIPAVFPPLAENEWVNEEKGRLIRIVLQGMTGETVVGGVKYNGAMPPWGGTLSDAEIAAVLTFIRSNWGNEAPPVTSMDVAAVRTLTSARKSPWTDKELRAVENMTVPGQSETANDSVDTDSAD